MTDTTDTTTRYSALTTTVNDKGIVVYAPASTTAPEEYPNLNVDLMVDVLNTITTVDGLWDQSTWRRTETLDFANMPPAEAAVATAALDQKFNPSCGTPMCFAGWATQLGGAPFVVSARVLKLIREQNKMVSLREAVNTLGDMVLVARNATGSPTYDHYTWRHLREAATNVVGDFDLAWLAAEIRKDHGADVFEKFSVASVSDAANLLLGIGHDDPLDLFEGGNDLLTVAGKVNDYLAGVPRYDDDEEY